MPRPVTAGAQATGAYLPIYSAIIGFVTVGMACMAAREIRGPRPASFKLIDAPVLTARADIATLPVTLPIAAPTPSAAVTAGADDDYYQSLRTRVRWVDTRIGRGRYLTPDYDSRLVIAKAAAQRAGLDEVGLGFRDVYGIITAETSWVPRNGRGRSGTPSLGVAQFEPATARALGLRDPDDLVEAVHVAAVHMKEAALWSAERIAGLKLPSVEHAAKLREGISIYYNLSSRGRAIWNGRNTDRLPMETQRHIANARMGAQEAALLDGQLQARHYARQAGAASTVAAVVTPRRIQ